MPTTTLADLAALAPKGISRAALDPAELAAHLGTLGGAWAQRGENLVRSVTITGMTAAPGIAAGAVAIADALDHHPRIVLDYGSVELAIHTHDRHAITLTDILFAARFETWLAAQPQT